MCDEKLCHTYDEELELPYINDQSHFNKLGTAKLYPYTKNVIESTLKKLNKL